MTKTSQVQRTTTNYAQFAFSEMNRPQNLRNRAELRRSLAETGWEIGCPMRCHRANGKLIIDDGQHRFLIAKELRIPLWYVVGDKPLDIALINRTQRPWTMIDYAMVFRNLGKKAYEELLEFATTYALPISGALWLMEGVSGSNQAYLTRKFRSGRFEIRNRDNAHRIAAVYNAIVTLRPEMKVTLLLQALIAVFYIGDFEEARLLAGARKQPGELMKYGTREGYLLMLEKLYNHGRRQKCPLKIAAENALKARNRGYKEECEAE